jgi:hypothetical protein
VLQPHVAPVQQQVPITPAETAAVPATGAPQLQPAISTPAATDAVAAEPAAGPVAVASVAPGNHDTPAQGEPWSQPVVWLLFK